MYILLSLLVVGALLFFALIKVYPEDVIRSKMLIETEDEEASSFLFSTSSPFFFICHHFFLISG